MFQMLFNFKLTLADFRHQYNRTEFRWLNYMGGYVRKTARNSLKQAKQAKSDEDLTDAQLDVFVIRSRIAEREGRPAPELPDKVSQPGRPPLLHWRPSPLKVLLNYAVDMNAGDVVIGPALARSGIVHALEFGSAVMEARPFMGPAERKARPIMARKWANAIN